MNKKIPNSTIIPQYGNALRKGSTNSIVDFSESVKIDFNFQLHRIGDMITEFNGEMAPNRIPHYIIAIITEGSGIKNIGSYSFEIEAGIAMIFPKNVIHSSQNWALNTKGFMLTFNEALFEEFQFPLSFVGLPQLFKHTIQPHQKVDSTQMDKIVSTFRELSKLKETMFGQNRKLFILKLAELIVTYSKIFVHEDTSDKNNNLLDRFNELLELDFKHHREVQYFANKLSLHPNYLNRLVQTQYRLSAQKYIQNRTFLEAKYLLSSTEIPTKEIAFELGFHDYNYFCRQFKKVTGTSPGEYRKLNN